MEKIRATMILEVLGRPPEHLTIALNNMIEKIGEEKGLEILETIKNEPKELEDHKDLYTTFAEVTFEVESILHYFGIIFAYMPSNIEIISPDHIDFSNYDLSAKTTRLRCYSKEGNGRKPDDKTQTGSRSTPPSKHTGPKPTTSKNRGQARRRFMGIRGRRGFLEDDPYSFLRKDFEPDFVMVLHNEELLSVYTQYD